MWDKDESTLTNIIHVLYFGGLIVLVVVYIGALVYSLLTGE